MSLQIVLYHRFLDLPNDILNYFYNYIEDHWCKMEKVNQIFYSVLYRPCHFCNKQYIDPTNYHVLDHFVETYSEKKYNVKLKHVCKNCYNEKTCDFNTICSSGMMHIDNENVKYQMLYMKEKSTLF